MTKRCPICGMRVFAYKGPHAVEIMAEHILEEHDELIPWQYRAVEDVAACLPLIEQIERMSLWPRR